jgi:diaminopimelate decarboxylase
MDSMARAVKIARAEPNVRLAGIHVFAGTQCLEASAILENLRGTLEIARRLCDEHDVSPEYVNLGGGFGIPYFAGQDAIDVDALSRGVGEELKKFRAAQPRFGKTRFILELGRFMIGMFGAYVARVTEIKETRGKRYVILDGGMNHCFPATGNFGQLVKKNYPVRNLTRGGAQELEGEADGPAQEVCGPLCTPMDSMARAVKIARAEPGDLIAFLHSGAYSYAASPLLFLSHDTPLELVKHDGQVVAARPRMSAMRFFE